MRALALIAALALWACSRPVESTTPDDPTPFKLAMEAEIAKRKYGVTVDVIEGLTVEGDTAVAAIRVGHKDSTGLKPRWDVTFKRVGEAWQVDQIEK